MSRRPELNELTAREVLVHVAPDRFGSNRILRALEDERLRLAPLGRSARLSERNVTRAKCLAISGSVRQKLLVSSSPSSGRSGLPMITGAMVLDQPR